ncbi:Toprim domain protein [compost metagenome]
MYAPNKRDVLQEANGRWLGIYQKLAPELVEAQRKPGKAFPCPVHGGVDGFRVFRKTADSTGGGVCQTCGFKPDGLALLSWVRNWNFHEALQEVGSLLGVKDPDGRVGKEGKAREIVPRQIKQEVKQPSNEWLRETMRKVWKESVPLTHPTAEPARLYLRSRGILAWDRPGLESTVRFHPALSARTERGRREFPAIVAIISDTEGAAVVLHRIFLTAKGEKAPLVSPKMMFPIPTDRSVVGGGIRTSQPGEVVDVCEGLETALAIETAMGLPVWSLVNAYYLENFCPQPAVKAVRIWADLDRKGRGQEAAKNLKQRLWSMGIKARIMLPNLPIPAGAKGVDWNDVLLERGSMAFLGEDAYRATR